MLGDALKAASDQKQRARTMGPIPSSAYLFADKMLGQVNAPLISAANASSALTQPQPLAAGLTPPGPNAYAEQAGRGLVQRTGEVAQDLARSNLNPMLGPFTSAIEGVGLLGGLASKYGTLTPEQSQAEADAELAAASANQSKVDQHAEVRRQLRAMSPEQALTTLGAPSAPDAQPKSGATANAPVAVDINIVNAAKARKDVAALVASDPDKQVKQTAWLNVMQTAASSAIHTTTSVIQGAIDFTELAAAGLTGTEAERSNARAFFDGVDKEITKLMPGDKARSKDFLTTLASAGGSMTAFMLATAAAYAIGAPLAAGAGVAGALSTADTMYTEAEGHSATMAQKWFALVAGSGLGATEMLPFEHAFSRIDNITGGAVQQLLQRTLSTGLSEFFQEVTQNVGQDVAAQSIYDPDREIDWRGALEQGAAGFILGGFLGAGGGVSQQGEAPQQPAEADMARVGNEVFAAADKQIAEALGTAASEPGAAVPLAVVVPPPETPPEEVAAVMDAQVAKVEQSARAITQTLEFKNWFGDSKTVGANGEPMVFYHGTVADVSAFDPKLEGTGHLASKTSKGGAMFFTSRPEVAEDFAGYLHVLSDDKTEVVRRYETGANITPVFISLKNPAIWDVYGGAYEEVFVKRAIREAKRDKNDGVVFTNMRDGSISTVGPWKSSHIAVAFKPTQVKSVNNSGSFDPTDPDLLAMTATGDGEAFVDDFDLSPDLASDVSLSLDHKKGRTVELVNIQVGKGKKGKGLGSKAMLELTDAADAAGVRLVLSAAEDADGSDGGLAYGDLVSWYEKFGFEMSGGSSRMTRYPADPDLLAMTSNSRAPFKGEKKRPASGVPATQPTPATADEGLSIIAQDFAKAMGATVRTGRLTLKGGAVGQYSRKNRVIRLKNQTDLSVLVHEAGHLWHDERAGPLDKFIQRNKAAIIALGDKLYSGGTGNLKQAEQVREGVAELVRTYTLNRPFLVKQDPALAADFDKFLKFVDPGIAKVLDAVGDKYAAWLALSSDRMVKTFVVSSQTPTEAQKLKDELADVGWKGFLAERTRKILGQGVNKFVSVDRAVNELLNIGEDNAGRPIDLKKADDPRVWLRLGNNSGALAFQQLQDGVQDFRTTNRLGAGLQQAIMVSQGLDPNASVRRFDQLKLDDFDAYLVALRAIDEYDNMAARGLVNAPVPFTRGDAVQAVKDYETRYGTAFTEAAKMVHDYGMALWKRSYDAGLVDREVYVENTRRKFYVPLMRDMSDRKGNKQAPSVLTKGEQSIVKRFRGSGRNIVSPVESLMHKTFALEQTIVQNEAKKLLAQLADKAGPEAGSIVERIPAKHILGTQLSVEAIARKLTDLDDVSATDAVDLLTILQSTMDANEFITMFKSETVAGKGENIAFFWEAGKLQAMQVQDGEAGADIVEIFNAAGRETMPLMTELIAVPATVVRSAITMWPDFLIKNFLVDQVTTWVNSDVGFIPFYSGVKGMVAEVRQSDLARSYNASMGLMGGANVAALHEARVDHEVAALKARGYTYKLFRDGVVKGMAEFAGLTETGTRMAAYELAVKRGVADGLTEYEAAIEAGYLATDLMNYGQHGSRMGFARRVVPFLNAQLIGWDKLIRTFTGDEVAKRKGLMFALSSMFKDINGLPLSRTEKIAIRTGRKAWIKMAGLAAISALIELVFKDDPDYQETSPYLRATGWNIPVGDGTVFWFPKPYEIGVVGNFTERAIEYIYGDTAAMGRFIEGAMTSLVPPVTSPIAGAVTEQVANYSFFTGQPIVPKQMQRLPPELQFDNYTSELGKAIGNVTGLSPMRTDHVLSALFTNAFRDVTSVSNQLNPTRPDMNWTDAPLLRRFLRSTERGSQASKDFWAQASGAGGALDRAEAGYKSMTSEASAEAFLQGLDADGRAYAILNTDFGAEYKRMHPISRARDVSGTISSVMKEVGSSIGLNDTSYGEASIGDTIALSPSQKRDVNNILNDLSLREVRNALITFGAPGWSDKKPANVQLTKDMLANTYPAVADELQRRLTKKKVYDADVVAEQWPELKARLLSDRQDALLDDLLAVARSTAP